MCDIELASNDLNDLRLCHSQPPETSYSFDTGLNTVRKDEDTAEILLLISLKMLSNILGHKNTQNRKVVDLGVKHLSTQNPQQCQLKGIVM